MEDIEDSIERYYRNLIAADIDRSLFNGSSENEAEIHQAYWFNQGLMYASMIARWGIDNDRG